MPDLDSFYDGPMPAKNVTLQKALEGAGTKTIQYVYDFDDDWNQSTGIEKVNEAVPGATFADSIAASVSRNAEIRGRIAKRRYGEIGLGLAVYMTGSSNSALPAKVLISP